MSPLLLFELKWTLLLNYKIRKFGQKKNCANYYLLHNTSKTIQFSTAYYIPNIAQNNFSKYISGLKLNVDHEYYIQFYEILLLILKF